MGYFRILSAIPGFFISSFLLMVLWGAIAPDLDIKTIGYPMAMLVNITLWLAVAPLAATGRWHGHGRWGKWRHSHTHGHTDVPPQG